MSSWQPIDFHGIVTLNKSVVEELREYLEDKEALLAALIVNSIPPVQREAATPALEAANSEKNSLLSSVEYLRAHVEGLSQQTAASSLHSVNWKIVVKHINHGLWDYLEMLEGMVSEFFQQLDQIGFERWNSELIDVVESLKALLQQKLREICQANKQLEVILKAYKSNTEKNESVSGKIKGFFHLNLLDKDLKSNIAKTEKFLGFRYQTFMHRVKQYRLLNQSTEQSTKKFDAYLIFNQLDHQQRHTFLRLYQWIRIWELNQTTKSLPEHEPVRAIRNLQAPEKLLTTFKEYEKALREALFSRSRLIKLQPHSLIDLISKIQHQHSLQGQMAEVHTLGTTVRKYRDFLLRTDPNPYIRSRLGFGEWIVGPEPAIAKSMSDLIFSIENLDELFLKMMRSVEGGDLNIEELDRLKASTQQTLHEMTQPLASYSLMLGKGKTFVDELQHLNELGSTHQEVVGFIGESLGKALRSDWKFHVLHEIPEFHELFIIHQGVVGATDDRSHANRLQRFKKITHEIVEWVKNNDSHKHLDEIEMDISDLKGYLQDFLAMVQRLATKTGEQQSEIVQAKTVSQQLLEYRYLFGQFFHNLRRDKAEERVIRNQFLFVDQYFESIENKLQELRTP